MYEFFFPIFWEDYCTTYYSRIASFIAALAFSRIIMEFGGYSWSPPSVIMRAKYGLIGFRTSICILDINLICSPDIDRDINKSYLLWWVSWCWLVNNLYAPSGFIASNEFSQLELIYSLNKPLRWKYSCDAGLGIVFLHCTW